MGEIPAGIMEAAEAIVDRIAKLHTWKGDCVADVALAILGERQRCADEAAAAVMKFRKRVSGKYYPGYHEDMRDAVRASVMSKDAALASHTSALAERDAEIAKLREALESALPYVERAEAGDNRSMADILVPQIVRAALKEKADV